MLDPEKKGDFMLSVTLFVLFITRFWRWLLSFIFIIIFLLKKWLTFKILYDIRIKRFAVIVL